MKQFGLTCSAKAMHVLLIMYYSEKVNERVAVELKVRLISIYLDIIKRILGITAQCIKDWTIHISYLAMGSWGHGSTEQEECHGQTESHIQESAKLCALPSSGPR